MAAASPARQSPESEMPMMELSESVSKKKTMERKSLLEDTDDMGSPGEKTEMSSSRLEPLVFRRNLHTEATMNEIYTDQSEPQTACDVIRNTCRVSPKCVGLHVLGYFPFVRFLRTYQWRQWLLADVISGLSAGFIHLPQGLGFGLLASLAPVYGLYSTFFPIVVYLVFGTSPHVSMGTNALIALLTASLVTREADSFRAGLGDNATSWTEDQELQYKVGIAAASSLVGGLILLGMGLLRLGFITNFMAKPFIGGFTFSAAIHITTSQIVKMLHIKIPGHSGMGKLVKTYIDIFKNIQDANPADVIVGLICMAVLLAVKLGINERFKDRMKMPVPIELLVVIISTIISHFAHLHDRFDLAVVGGVPAGLPAPSLPDMDSLSSVAADSFVTAILIFALTISLAKLTAKAHDITIDDNQEMVAYGMCLLVGAFFQNFPACTAPPRTMLLSSLGSKSTFNGVMSAAFILLVLLVAGPLFVSLPIAMLAAMIIVAMKDLLLQIRNLKSLWNINKPDFFIWVVTALFCVFGDLDVGLLVGVIFSMVTVMVVGQLTKGTLLGKPSGEDMLLPLDRKGVSPVPGVNIFRFESPLYFANQERFKSQLYSLVLNPNSVPKRRDTVTRVPSPDDEFDGDNDNDNQSPSSQTKEKIMEKKYDSDPSDSPDSSVMLEKPAGKTVACNGSEKEGEKGEEEEEEEEAEVGGKKTPRPAISHVILDCSAMTYIDVAGVDVLTLVQTQFSRVGVDVWLASVPAGSLGTLERAGFLDKLGRDKIFYSVLDALQRLRDPETYIVRL